MEKDPRDVGLQARSCDWVKRDSEHRGRVKKRETLAPVFMNERARAPSLPSLYLQRRFCWHRSSAMNPSRWNVGKQNVHLFRRNPQACRTRRFGTPWICTHVPRGAASTNYFARRCRDNVRQTKQKSRRTLRTLCRCCIIMEIVGYIN